MLRFHGPPRIAAALERIERLVPLVPRPRINLLLYHGVLAPNVPWWRAVVAQPGGEGVAIPGGASSTVTTGRTVAGDVAPRHRMRPRYRTWATLIVKVTPAD